MSLFEPITNHLTRETNESQNEKLNIKINSDDIKLYLGDCLDVMGNIEDKSVDMILCDLPYGTTHNKWDVIIPFDKLWKQYERIIKDNGVVTLFAQGIFLY